MGMFCARLTFQLADFLEHQPILCQQQKPDNCAASEKCVQVIKTIWNQKKCDFIRWCNEKTDHRQRKRQSIKNVRMYTVFVKRRTHKNAENSFNRTAINRLTMLQKLQRN